jgi:hypothetical protein
MPPFTLFQNTTNVGIILFAGGSSISKSFFSLLKSFYTGRLHLTVTSSLQNLKQSSVKNISGLHVIIFVNPDKAFHLSLIHCPNV